MKRSMTFFLSLICATAMMAAPVALAAETETETAVTETVSEAETETGSETETEAEGVLEDGTYTAEFDTDSSMFHVNEANDGKGVLTVKDGEMTIHVSLSGKGFLNLFMGTSEDAKKDGFDIPVPAIDEEFTVAAIGKKGKWYDHKVSVKNPVKEDGAEKKTVADLNLEDGDYTAEVTLEGGSGRATVDSPAAITIKEGAATATVVWSSPNYDYMLVNGEKYEPVNTEGNSTFEIPVDGFDYPMEVVADTVAMSEPHEIEYTLQFDSSSMEKAE